MKRRDRVPVLILFAAAVLAFPAGGSAQPFSFGSPTDFATGGQNPVAIAVGDLNRDGKLDLVTANRNSNNVAVLLGTSPGSFGAATTLAVGGDPLSVAIGDVNRDGKLDIVVANNSTNNVSVLLGNGDGTFQPAVSFAAGTAPVGLAIGDVNGDGKPDLAVTNAATATVSVLLGTGGVPLFGAAQSFAVGLVPFAVAIADLDGDGKADLAVANQVGDSLSVLLGTGATPLFGTALTLVAGDAPVAIAVGELGGDGRPDVVVANFFGDSDTVYLSGTFSLLPLFGLIASSPAGDNPVSLAIADFNGDGRPDLAVASQNTDEVLIRAGNGGGPFGTLTSFAIGHTPRALAVGDFNGDGKPDVAIVTQDVVNNVVLNNITVLLNTAVFTPSGAFGVPTNLSVGNGPLGVAVADVNRDGKPDLVATNGQDDSFSLFLATALGSFGPASTVPVDTTVTPFTPNAVVAADLDRDGTLDLVAADQDADRVSVLLGTGSGGFGAATHFAVGDFPGAVAVGDFNRDGILDLAVPNAGIDPKPNARSDNVSILLGNGDGTFQAAVNYAVGAFPAWVAIGDVNRDGKLDLVVANRDTDDVSVLLGNGDGTFQTAVSFAVGNGPTTVAIGDFDGDGKPDLAVGNFLGASSSVSILLGNGDGTFDPPADFPAPNPIALVVGDVNRDGKLDVVTTTHGGNGIAVLLGNGDGTLGPATTFAVGQSFPDALALADVDGDGRPDIVTANFGSNSISVLLNVGPALSVTVVGTGTVTSNPPGINCGTDCTEAYNALTVVTLTATAGSGFGFTGWSGACTGTGTCTVTVRSSETVTATFEDTTAPSGAVVVNGGATVTTSPVVTVGLTCTDNVGCTQMQVAVDGIADTEPFEPLVPSKVVTLPAGDGTRTVAARFRDAAGNTSGQATDTIVLDETAPTLALPADIVVPATSSAGAAVTFTATATDSVDPSPSVACSPVSGSVFGIGTTTVTCTATDFTGHSTSGSFTVTVQGAAAQLGDLINTVNSLNIQPAGVANSLTAKLQAAIAAANSGNLATACNQLNAFINEVQAQSGKKLTVAQANQLIAQANQVKAVLGCP